MKISIKRICFLFIAIFICTYIKVQANEYIRFNNILIEHGLSQGTINTIFQDSKGYLWIGSDNGLNKYNGYDFLIYRNEFDNENTLLSDHIFDVEEDEEGNIWVGTMYGISKINPNNQIKNYAVPDKSGINVSSIVITENNDIIIATGTGVYIYNKEEDGFIEYIDNNKLSSSNLNGIDKDIHGNIWVASEAGLNKINNSSKEVEHYLSKDDHLYSVYCDGDYIWAGSYNNGAYRLDSKTKEVIHYEHNENIENSIAGNVVKSIIVDSKDNVWFGTNTGLSQLNKKTNKITNYTKNDYDYNSLVNNMVYSVEEDSSGNIWVGTYSGVSVFNPYSEIVHHKSDPFDETTLSDNMIKGLYEDDEGYIWVGTNEKGVDIFNNNFEKVYNISKSTSNIKLSSNTVNGISGYKNYILISTNSELNILNKDTREMHYLGKDDGLVYNNIQQSLVDSSGNLWIATGDGVNVLKKNGQSFDNLNNLFDEYSIDNYYTRVLFEDSRKNVWIGNFVAGGLIRINIESGEVKNYTTSNSNLSNNVIRCITEDMNGDLWIGTSLGINKYIYDTEEFVHYTSKDGLSNDTVYGVVIDEDNNPWLSTNLGISKYDVENDIFIKFTVSDGLQSNEFNGLSYLKLRNGDFVFGGINGLNVINPESIKIEDIKPQLIKDKIALNGVQIDTISGKKLKYSENTISIKFFVKNFKNLSAYKYYYKVNDGEWSLMDSNSILLSNLSPGKYKYRFKVESSSGISSDELIVEFDISEVWWKSLNFQCFLIIMIIILVIYYKNKVKVLNMIVDKKTKNLKDEIKKNKELFNKVLKLEKNKNNYFVNLSHELRTPLNIIYSTQQLVMDLNKTGIVKEKLDDYMEIVGRNSKRLLKMINDIIDTSKIENGAYHLNIKKNDIVYLVEESVLSLKEYIEGKGVTLIVDPEFEEKIIECDYEVIERCIINLVSNAAKFTKEGDTITVNIKEKYAKVIIEVIDTGIGIEKKYHATIFDRFNQVIDENSENKGGSGLGLAITKQMVELHNGKIYLESELGKGCKFVIVLPQ